MQLQQWLKMAGRGVYSLSASLLRIGHLCNTARMVPQLLIRATSSSGSTGVTTPLLPGSHPLLRMSTTASSTSPKKKPKQVNITFIDRDGDEHTVKAKIGDTLLEVAKEYDIDVEGACEGTLSCSTCHLIVDSDWYKKIPDPLTEEEQDMLDLAYGLTDTSRLGCQILVSEALEGLRLAVPAATKDVRNQ